MPVTVVQNLRDALKFQIYSVRSLPGFVTNQMQSLLLSIKPEIAKQTH